MVSVAVLAAFGAANAAQNVRAGLAGGTNSQRMPTMPTVSLNTIGNPAVNTISQPAGVQSGGIPTPIPTPTPTPTPTPSNCPDGGVANSSYTVAMCMDDLLQCVNTGALQGGLNDLFNSDVRNSIMSGMKLCQSVIDKCVREVRVDCRNIYAATTDVWLDFNSRVIQPEYYNFVLRKTGLTPNQAENTCLLLDRNTYGASFTSVSDADVVNSEYNNYVGAYNRQMNNTLSKDNPQGVEINTTGYDGNRGHYARWDAANAECLIRVAAYNKDNLITNRWLGIGDDSPAEVWQKAGSTFTCNKDLFDFSLMNQTKSAAVIAVPAGTALGAGIGAAAGAGAYNKKLKDAYGDIDADNIPVGNCANKEYRAKLDKYLDSHPSTRAKLTTYIKGSSKDSFYGMSEEDCKKISSLWNTVEHYEAAIALCRTESGNNARILNYSPAATNDDVVSSTTYVDGMTGIACTYVATTNCETGEDGQTVASEAAQNIAKDCSFKIVTKGLDAANVLCSGTVGECVNAITAENQVAELRSLLNELSPIIGTSVSAPDKGKEIGKGVAIGAVTGAGVGGLVTGITALVERGNISCKVGDGLNSVGLGKSHTIDSLKDFYVKWNLRLPDTITPTSVVSDEASWQQACSQFNNRLMDCPNVQVNLKRKNSSGYTLVSAACRQSGSVCIANESVMNSYLLTPIVVVTPVVVQQSQITPAVVQ